MSDRCPCGGTIEPINDDWAKCDICGDASFPISADAAGGEFGTPRITATVEGTFSEPLELGTEAVREMELLGEIETLRTQVSVLTQALTDLRPFHHKDAQKIIDEALNHGSEKESEDG